MALGNEKQLAYIKELQAKVVSFRYFKNLYRDCKAREIELRQENKLLKQQIKFLKQAQQR